MLQKYESIKTESQLLCMHVSKFTNRPENFEIELYMFLQKQVKSLKIDNKLQKHI